MFKRYAALGLLILAASLLLGDFLLKGWIHDSIPLIGSASSRYPYGGVPVFQNFLGIDFSINHITNHGAAWGVFAKFAKPLFYFRIAATIGLFIYLLFFNRKKERTLGLVLIIAGAIGNIIDFFRYGHVIDMFYFVFWGYSYPLFNLADTWIFCGLALFVLQSLLQKRSHSSDGKMRAR